MISTFLCAGLAAAIAVSPGSATIPYIKDSPSEILNQELIFAIEVLSLGSAAPQKARIGSVAEPLLRGRLLDLYKGRVAEALGAEFRARPSIYAGPIRDLPQEASGLFSLQAPQPGERWVVFCSPGSPSAHVGELLSGLTPKCRAAYHQPGIFADLELVRQLEASHAEAPAALAALGKQRSTLGFLIGEYFIYKYKVEKLPGERFNDLLKIIESSDISAEGRSSLLRAVDSSLTMIESTPAASKANENRFILGMFRIFYTHRPTAQPSHDSDLVRNLVGTFIPNWLGLTSGLRPRAAAEIFAGHPEDRARVRAALETLPAAESQRLLAWLKKP